MLATIRRMPEACQPPLPGRLGVFYRVRPTRSPCAGRAEIPLARVTFRSTIQPARYYSASLQPASKEVTMFDSLADKIRQDEHETANKTERFLKWGFVAIASIVLFGGLYVGVRFLE